MRCASAKGGEKGILRHFRVASDETMGFCGVKVLLAVEQRSLTASTVNRIKGHLLKVY